MKCIICGEALNGPLEIYGEVNQPLCWTCWADGRADESESAYGFFPGGDPRDFTPDFELCTPDEIAAWKADVAAWEAGNGRPTPPSCTRVYDSEGKLSLHILAPRYGIGVYKVRHS